MSRKIGDIYIDNAPFPVTSYLRGTTDDMVAKFGSPEKGQTNLDLLKAQTQKGWRGGMFQKQWTDDEMAGFISGMHHNPLDEKLYFTPDMDDQTRSGGMDDNGVADWCYWQGYLWIIYYSHAPTPTTRMDKIDIATGAVTGITLPTAIQNNGYPFRICAYDDYLFIAGKPDSTGGLDAYRYNGTTFTAVTGGFIDFIEFRNKLYAIAHHNTLFQITNHTAATITWTAIKDVGPADASNLRSYKDMLEYNGALYIGMAHGLYRYDGIDVSCVINMQKSVNQRNFQFMAVMNGRLYYTINNRLYEFDGANITLIHDFAESYVIINMTSSPDRLWISVRYNATSPSTYESDNFDDPIYGATYKYGLITYNGVGFYEYKNEQYYGSPSAFGDYTNPVKYTAIQVGDYINWIRPYNRFNASLEPRSDGFKNLRANLATEFDVSQLGDTKEGQIIGSEFDAGYPSVPKTLNGVMVEYEDLGDNVHLSVEVQTEYEGVKSAFTEIWNSDNVAADGATNDYLLHEQVYNVGTPDLETEPLPFERCVYRVLATISGAVTAPPRIRNLTLRYSLQPRMRRKWLLSLGIYGADPEGLETPTLGDGSEETRPSALLRRVLYNAYENKKPVLFYDIDFTKIIDDSPIQVAGQYLLKDNDSIAVKVDTGLSDAWMNRRIQVVSTGNDYTEITLDDIGHREGIGGSTNQTIAVNDEVRKAYVVYVKNIQNERVYIDDNTVNDGTAGYSDFPSELVVELVEV